MGKSTKVRLKCTSHKCLTKKRRLAAARQMLTAAKRLGFLFSVLLLDKRDERVRGGLVGQLDLYIWLPICGTIISGMRSHMTISFP